MSTATPTDNQIVAPQLSNHDPGPPNAKSRLRRGVFEGAEQLRSPQGDGATGAVAGKITSIFAAETPKGRMRSARGRFFLVVSFIAYMTSVLHIITHSYPP